MARAQTVLHVDDDPNLLQLSRESFRRAVGADVEVVTAGTAEEGLAVLGSRRVESRRRGYPVGERRDGRVTD